MKKLLLKFLKYRKTAVTTIFTNPVVTEEWVLFGRFTIYKNFKSY
ncbi:MULTISPECIES: hypothetical protein [unclassified Chryseobacterium]|nr:MULTISPECIES: hypothetical protein [unclassified Chryseobacterium]